MFEWLGEKNTLYTNKTQVFHEKEKSMSEQVVDNRDKIREKLSKLYINTHETERVINEFKIKGF